MSMEQEFVTSPAKLEVSGTPLRHFKGKLDDIIPHDVNGVTRVNLNFTSILVLRLIPGAVYDFPVAQLDLKYSKKGNSGWGKMLKSLDNHPRDKVGDPPDLLSLKGHVLEMEAREENYGRNTETNQDMVGLVWEVKGVDGATAAPVAGGVSTATTQSTAADPMEHVLDLVHGRTAAEFAEVALQDGELRQRSGDIYDNSLLSGLVQAGKIYLAGDKYMVAGRAEPEINAPPE